MEVERRELEFLTTLGSGGFGAVYLANLHGRDRFVRRVAVKVMREGLDATPDLVARQKDEARLLGLLAHDGIVQVLDLAEVEGRPAVVMEYVEGVDLADLIKSTNPRRIPIRAALEIVAGVASALDAAYNSTSAVTGQPLRVIHRDIKPANMLLTVHGRVKVLDFGVAKADFARDGHTTNGGWGTPRFMSPEQWLGEPYGAPVDVYALGVTLFDLVADRSWERPPLARTPFEHHVGQQLDNQADVPEAVLALVAAMTAFDPADRPTAAEVRERCETLASELVGESLARFARAEVPQLVEARRRTNANKPLPGAVSLRGLSPSGGARRAEPTHHPSEPVPREPSGHEPSIVPPPAQPQPPRFGWAHVAGAVVGLGALSALVVALLVGNWVAGGLPGAQPAGEPPPVELADEPTGAQAAPAAPVAVEPAPADPAPEDGGAASVATEPPPAAVAPTPKRAPSKTRPTEPAATSEATTANTPARPPPREPVPTVPTWPLDVRTDAIGHEVWIDGGFAGTTPLSDAPLTAGTHTVVVSVDGVRSEPKTVLIGPDGPPGVKYYPAERVWRNTK